MPDLPCTEFRVTLSACDVQARVNPVQQETEPLWSRKAMDTLLNFGRVKSLFHLVVLIRLAT